ELLQCLTADRTALMRVLRTMVQERLVAQTWGRKVPAVPTDAADLLADIMKDAAAGIFAILPLDVELIVLVEPGHAVWSHGFQDVCHRCFLRMATRVVSSRREPWASDMAFFPQSPFWVDGLIRASR